MDTESKSEILHLILDMGEMMTGAGAEVKRVENTIVRLGSAFGAQRTDALVITPCIVVTMKYSAGEELTQTRRMERPSGTDLNKLEKLNALSRACCENGMTAQELREKIETIKNDDVPKWYVYTGSVLVAASFAIFFGGSLADGAAAGLFAGLICLCQEKLSPKCPNRIIFNLLCSLIAGLAIGIFARMVPGLHEDMIIIGDIMLLIPGIAITNSVKDMLVGDTIAGTMRFLESILWAAALAGGFMVSFWIVGG